MKLTDLEQIIADRALLPNNESYTSRLLTAGKVSVAKKIAEEGAEVALAIAAESADRVADEAADLIYHLLVGLHSRGLSMDDVKKVLASRHEGHSD
ncbi:MAG: phosphoribosyl-ATP pyrophosphatase [Lysobacteraceae bacterium]|nr:MAG: phosphoribosyl-ATP pyrophosphatase [Xanthomonadaceae bacterium]